MHREDPIPSSALFTVHISSSPASIPQIFRALKKVYDNHDTTMTPRPQAEAGPSLPSTSSSRTESSPGIPILLLKTRSLPTDAYQIYFTSTTTSFNPIFVPVLQHSFNAAVLEQLSALLPNLSSQYSGLIFTSQRAVEAFASIIHFSDAQAKGKLKELSLPIYTVGPATSRALEGLRDEFFPRCEVLGRETGNGEGLAGYILQNHRDKIRESWGKKSEGRTQETPLEPLPLLFLVGEQRRDIIPKTLSSPSLPRTSRLCVQETIVYETQVMSSFASSFAAILQQTPSSPSNPVKWIIVFSPTGCAAMLRVLGWLDEEIGKAFRKGQENEEGKVYVACIGPTTREYLEKEFGFEVDVCAEKPSPEGVGEGIERFMREKGIV